MRIEAEVPDIVASYADSIHGKGLIESGLVVTATCVNCHTLARRAAAGRSALDGQPRQPRRTPAASATTASPRPFAKSIHATGEAKDGHQLPVCEDCHSSHTIGRADLPGFRTRMMDQCGRCHEEQAETFFETFHGKVSRLGTEGAAKCSDCHGSHDILPIDGSELDAQPRQRRRRPAASATRARTAASRAT